MNFAKSVRRSVSTASLRRRRPGEYCDIAAEYYDGARHPTCANFREASAQFLSDALEKVQIANALVCEVGAGKSVVAEILSSTGVDLRRLSLVDLSPAMLEYSKHWEIHGVHLRIGDARCLYGEDESVDIVVSSLGDAYNERAFWLEVTRVLKADGVCVFTTPSYGWAAAFRDTNDIKCMTTAEFELRDVSMITVPSLIYPRDEQADLIEMCGLHVIGIQDIPIRALRETPLSPKLMPERGRNASVVEGYIVRKVRSY